MILSPRLHKLFQFLKSGEKTGMQIQKHTRSMATHSDISDLRDALFLVAPYWIPPAIYKGRTRNKKKIYAYKLEKLPTQVWPNS